MKLQSVAKRLHTSPKKNLQCVPKKHVPVFKDDLIPIRPEIRWFVGTDVKVQNGNDASALAVADALAVFLKGRIQSHTWWIQKRIRRGFLGT